MNIFFLELNLAPSIGGVERVTYLIGHELERHGHNVYYGYRYTDESDLPERKKLKYSFESSKEELHKLLYDFIKTNNIDVIIDQGMWHKNLRSFVKKYRKELDFKIIYCLHISPIAYKEEKTKKLSIQIKNIISKLFFGTDVIAHGMKRIYEFTDGFVILSKSLKSKIVFFYGLSSDDKLHAISNPLSFKRKNNSVKKENTVLVVSRFDEISKNLKSALRIWKRIENAGYDNWQLKMVGYGPDEQEYINYAKELNLKRVIFEGKQVDVQSYYEKAKLFMMTSRHEGFGMTLIEAQQMGCVPMAYDTYSSLHDIISNERNGMIIPFEDEKQYAEKMMLLMDDETLWEKLMQCGMETSSAFNIENIVDSWCSLLSKIKKK